MKTAAVLVLSLLLSAPALRADEVFEETHTKVAVRNHPRTGKPFVSIAPELNDANPFGETKMAKRPDYRMLDPKIKPKDVGYEGPVSDRKKVYIFAASLATVGTVGGTAIIAAAPAATGAGAAGGAGIYGAAGTAVVAGTAAGTIRATRTDSDMERVNFKHAAEAKELETSKADQAESLHN